jgi:CO/xanthine dehydrogenase Mo-binding subunit
MVGGLAKVTGAVNYAPDLVLPRMLYAKALRSPFAHADLLRVDASKAEKLPGVVAVVTRDDLTGLSPYFGPVVDDQPVVATDRGATSAKSLRWWRLKAGRSPKSR